MDSSVHRHRRSASSDCFIDLFSLSPPSDAEFGGGNGGDELHESEVFWTGDFSETNRHYSLVKTGYLSRGFANRDNSGVVAVLPEVDDYQNQSLANRPTLSRKGSISPSSSSSAGMSPGIPRPPQIARDTEYSHSVPVRNFNGTAPMNFPVLSKDRNRDALEIDDEDEELEMLPPHEIVSKGSGVSPRTTFSVLEGVGRTLKGRDLRQLDGVLPWKTSWFWNIRFSRLYLQKRERKCIPTLCNYFQATFFIFQRTILPIPVKKLQMYRPSLIKDKSSKM